MIKLSMVAFKYFQLIKTIRKLGPNQKFDFVKMSSLTIRKYLLIKKVNHCCELYSIRNKDLLEFGLMA